MLDEGVILRTGGRLQLPLLVQLVAHPLEHELAAPELARRGVPVTGIELSPAMVAQLRRKVEGSARSAEVVQAPGEKLPFPDNSFDTVGFTYVLCTVPEPDAALREIARVLKPGGRLLFLEHVRSPEPGLARWQDRLHGAWYVFGHGCNCNRDTLATLEASPLEVEHADRGEIPGTVPLVKPMLVGSARR